MRVTPGLFIVVVVALLLAPGGADSGAPAPVLLHVTPQISASPGAFRATATVQRHRDNRKLVISADSDAYFRSSAVELEGENAPIRHVRVFDHLPAGTYEISAVLVRADGSQISDKLTGRVSGR